MRLNEDYKVQVDAKAEVFGDGQRIMMIRVRYPAGLYIKDVPEGAYEITGRTINHVKVHKNVVVIYLERDGKDGLTYFYEGKGREARLKRKDMSIEIRQVHSISTEFVELEAWSESLITTDIQQDIVEMFTQHVFNDPITENTIEYNLYVPKNALQGEGQLPLVLFMHDMGTCSEDVYVTLIQGKGAVSFAEPAFQEEYPCFILAPQYGRQVVNDEHETGWEVDGTLALIEDLCTRYPIDRAAIMGTGQSMGCMMLCAMNSRIPEFFKSSLLVAGQWEPSVMTSAYKNRQMILVSQGDRKAYPGMIACTEVMEKEGAVVVRGGINGEDCLSKINETIHEIVKEPHNIAFMWFEGDSIIGPEDVNHPGTHHVNTWAKAYDVDGLKRWLFQ